MIPYEMTTNMVNGDDMAKRLEAFERLQEARRKANKKYQQSDKFKESVRRYYEKTKEQRREYSRQYYMQHRQERNEYIRTYRARKKSAKTEPETVPPDSA